MGQKGWDFEEVQCHHGTKAQENIQTSSDCLISLP